MLTLALFSLAIPIVVLTIVAVLPLALPLIVVPSIGASLTGAWLGVRVAGRGIGRLGHGPGHPSVIRAQADQAAREAHHASGDAGVSGPRP